MFSGAEAMNNKEPETVVASPVTAVSLQPYYDEDGITIYNCDCLEILEQLGKVDLVLTDPPYGTTACKWDSVIPLEPMWEQLKRVIKPNGAIVLFGSEPFSSALRMSNIKNYKYDWIWSKSMGANFMNAKNAPLKKHELISVFSNGTTANRSPRRMEYYPQGLKEVNKKHKRPSTYSGKEDLYKRPNHVRERIIKFEGYPSSIIEFKKGNHKTVHPTQKPVALMEYLIKTYTNEGDTVLDFTMGSGTTGVACKNLNRRFIGIELDEQYFKIAQDRISAA